MQKQGAHEGHEIDDEEVAAMKAEAAAWKFVREQELAAGDEYRRLSAFDKQLFAQAAMDRYFDEGP